MPEFTGQDYWEDPAHVEAYATLVAEDGGAGLALREALIARFAEWLTATATVLELGMGTGVDLPLLARHFARVTGSDRSRAFLQRYLDRNPDADLLHLDAVSLATDRRFDGIYSNKVLPYLATADWRKSLEAQRRILRDGGIAMHTFWYGQGMERVGELRSFHADEGSLGTLLEALPQAFEQLVLERYTELEADDSIILILRALG